MRMFNSFIAEQVAHLSSRPLLEAAHKSISDSENNYNLSIHDIRHMLNVSSKEGIISVSAQHTDAPLAALVVNTLIDEYWSDIQSDNYQRFSAIESRLVERVAALGNEHQDIRRQLLEVGSEYSEEAISKAHLQKVTQITDLDQRLADLSESIADREAEGPSAYLDTGNLEIQRLTVLDHALADLLLKRVEHLIKLDDVNRVFSDTDFRVTNARSDLARIDQAIEARREQLAALGQAGVLTAGTPDKTNSLDSLRGLKSKLQNRLVALRQEARALNNKRVELQFLLSKQLNVSRYLAQARDDLENIRTESHDSTPGIVEIRAKGKIADSPVKDKRKQFAALGALGGAGIALLLLVVSSIFSRKVHYSDDLGRSAKKGLGLESVKDNGAAPAPEQFTNIWSQLCFSSNQRGRELRTISVFGSDAGVGTSTIARTIASSYAQVGKRALVIEGASRQEPHGASGRDGHESGLAEALLDFDVESRILSDVTNGVDLLPASASTEESRCSSPAWLKLSDQLLKAYDIIVLDMGSQNWLIAPRVVSATSDAVVLLATPGTSRANISTMKKTVGESCADRLLWIFNKAHTSDPMTIS
jgi:uncharacterized protein involved in exopolysaccharide biosynthesis